MAAADKTHRQLVIIGVTCGSLAALGWASGFVAAKHGIQIGMSPADITFHRFFWSGLVLLPTILRNGFGNLNGVGWGRAFVITILAGPTQALLAYTGFILVPLGHGATIQPACAALGGVICAWFFLSEKISLIRAIGGAAMVGGLLVFGAESLATIGHDGIVGDLLFVLAGLFWAGFGTLLRKWNLEGLRAAAAIAAVSMVVFVPAYFLIYGWRSLVQHGLFEFLLQALVQGLLTGATPIYLFTHAVTALGASRAAPFPALVPVFSVIIGFAVLGIVPSLAQFIGMLIVLAGFHLTLRK